MGLVVVLAHAALQVDVPVLDGLDDHLQLVGYPVLLSGLFAAFFQLDDFHVGSPVPVGVYHEAGRPAAGDVVEEEARQVRRTVKVLARPLGGVVHGDPVCQLGRKLGVQRVTVELVFAVAQEALLVQEVSAQYVGQLVQ